MGLGEGVDRGLHGRVCIYSRKDRVWLREESFDVAVSDMIYPGSHCLGLSEV